MSAKEGTMAKREENKGMNLSSETVYPSKEVVENARIREYESAYRRSIEDREGFWAEQAEDLEWYRRWEKVLDDSNPPFYKWFVGGRINVIHNAIDRHLKTWKRNKLAFIWEGEPGDLRSFSYHALNREVSKFANILKSMGVKKGEIVTIYMPQIPELAFAMLACAKIGAAHSVVYGGFSVEALAERIMDADSRVLITADGGWRRGKIIDLKTIANEAMQRTPTIEVCIVVKRTGHEVYMETGRDFWYHDLMSLPIAALTCETEVMDVFDIREEDRWWCAADPGWITGHSYIVYGPLINGSTVFMYEGAPNHPFPNRWWQMIEKYGITILYTSPTAIRGLMRFGDAWPNRHDLSGLRLLGTVGEPINPEAWRWYHRVIGKGACPIIDTWWQTETGGFVITPFPIMPLKPGSATKPFFGNEVAVVDDKGREVAVGEEGVLVIKSPWPGLARTIYKDPDRYREIYWEEFGKQGWYKTGDSARIDEDGYVWIIGRIDDVIKVSGYRLGTAEIESALVSHPDVSEAAAIALPHEIKGNAIHAHVILREGVAPSNALAEDLKRHVSHELGPIAKPETVVFTDSLPKTRSGKIMRRVLKARALGKDEGDLTTLEE